MSRLFTQAQKIAVELVTGRSGEADHIIPWSKGGKTTVENCQLISKETNQKKGAFMFEPREWQLRFFVKWEEKVEGKPFMLMAVPGSGKTMAAIEIARRWMVAGSDRRLIVVVPTDNLRTQWQQEARRFGIELQTKEFGTKFKDGFQGGVTSYHLVGNQPMVFRKLCSVAPTMVIFDEIHHCGEDSHFGLGIKEAFELSQEKLLMSGTPWKSDGSAIPFVKYDEHGFAVADYSYGYVDALKDEVIRWLVFDHSKGAITNDFTGQRLEIDSSISENQASERLSALLDPTGEYVSKQIEDSHRKLMECRKTVPDAAAMAICIDQFHATKIASAIKRITGCTPSVIVSDEQIGNDTVDAFRKSSKEWLVSVRKVSEGTDIKRLQVLCYLTNITSELFFRQVIGRVSRLRNMDDNEGYVFLPADPRLIRCAENIETEQVKALEKRISEPGGPIDEREQRELQIWSTEHSGTDRVFIGGEEITSKADKLKEIAESTRTSMKQVMDIIAQAQVFNCFPKDADKQDKPNVSSLEDKMDALRQKINNAAYSLSKNMAIDVSDIHRRFKPQAQMSFNELIQKFSQIQKWMQEAKNAQ
jgi:superfamily II DNA or RNA helicase